MNIEQAADFAFDMVKKVKYEMILAGLSSPEACKEACEKLSAILHLPPDMILEAMLVA